jgi:hypothetical protein
MSAQVLSALCTGYPQGQRQCITCCAELPLLSMTALVADFICTAAACFHCATLQVRLPHVCCAPHAHQQRPRKDRLGNTGGQSLAQPRRSHRCVPQVCGGNDVDNMHLHLHPGHNRCQLAATCAVRCTVPSCAITSAALMLRCCRRAALHTAARSRRCRWRSSRRRWCGAVAVCGCRGQGLSAGAGCCNVGRAGASCAAVLNAVQVPWCLGA